MMQGDGQDCMTSRDSSWRKGLASGGTERRIYIYIYFLGNLELAQTLQ